MYSFELLFVMRGRIATASIAMCLLFVLCSYSSTISNSNQWEESKAQATSGRSVHYGEWVIHRQIGYDDSCEDSYSVPEYLIVETSSENMLATYSSGCEGEYGDVEVFDVQDLSLIVSLNNEFDLREVEFSPDGQYLAIRSPDSFKLFDTSDWSEIVSESRNTGDGFLFSDLAWSGDSERLIVATGNNGGNMYEAPNWEEVEGTSSTGTGVAHHPTEDKIWYVGSDGSGNVYEYQDVPLAGKRWVMTRSFTVQGSTFGLTVSPDGDALLTTDGDLISIYSTSDYTPVDTIYNAQGKPKFSYDGSAFLSNYDYRDSLALISVQNWNLEEVIEPFYSYNSKIEGSFSSNDSEIFALFADYYDGTTLIGFMPDSDGDGIDDSLDQCPTTPSNEEPNTAGCSSSQRDTDNDGVNDKDDDCPRTQALQSVSNEGCSVSQLTDSDGDKVSDSEDLCPNSKNQSTPDRNGCTPSQRDTDGDGFNDEIDQCPLFVSEACPEVIIWQPQGEQVNGTESLSYFEYSPDGQYIAAFIENEYREIKILNEDFTPHDSIIFNSDERIIDLEWMPDSSKLLLGIKESGSDESKCKSQYWNVQSKQLGAKHTILEDCDSLYRNSMTFSPNGSAFVVATNTYGAGYSMIMMDSASMSRLMYEVDFRTIRFDFTLDGKWLIGAEGGQIVIWDATTYEFVEAESVRDSYTLQITPDGGHFTVYDDEIISIYELSTFEMVTSIKVTENFSEISDITFSRSGKIAYVTIRLDYCYSWEEDCETDKRVTSVVQSYLFETSNLTILKESEPIKSGSTLDPIFHPLEEKMHTKSKTNGNFVSWEKDSDGDGFLDIVDLCPDTPIESSVNEEGCGGEQLDDDNDGIANQLDLCPNTAAGVPADENGCSVQQVDSDYDGICNENSPSSGPDNCSGKDQCPDSATGVSIDQDGCSWVQQDTDGDGVSNGDDLCDYTEIIGDADENGCDRKQRDSDGDSINDYDDNCSSTSNGDLTDEAGCSDIQVDSDNDAICNRGAQSSGPSNCTGTDTCPNTGANESVDSNGCSWDQKDEDNDGIFNGNDACPGTAKPDGSPDGCSSWQRDSDDDGIADAIDECAKTPSNEFSNQVGCSDSQGQGSLASDGDDSSVTKWALIGGIILVVLLVGGFLLRRDELGGFGQKTSTEYPEYATRGTMREGQEWIEYPSGSGNSFYRDPSTGQWVKNE